MRKTHALWGGAVLLFVLFAVPAAFAGEEIVEEQDFDRLWNYGDPKGTEAKFRELLPAAREKDDRDYLVQLLTQIGRTHGLRGDFVKAHETLDEARDLLTAACVIGRIRYLLERGRTLNSSGKKVDAIAYFREALERAEKAGAEYHLVDAAHMLGIAEKGDGALAWNLKAIAMAEKAKSKRAKGWLGALYNNTAWTLHDMKEYGRALELFEKALAHYERLGNERPILIGRWAVARCQRSLGRLDEAMKAQRALLAVYEEKGEESGFVYEEIGEILWTQGKRDEARPWLAKAYRLLSKMGWVAREYPDRVKSLKERGGVEDE
jgi:tetratricopeptide (TPR) repeat protein